MSERQIDLQTQHETALEELKYKVDFAWEDRIPREEWEKFLNSNSSRPFKGKDGEMYVTYKPHSPAPNEIIITDSHDYMPLLKLSGDKLIQSSDLRPDELQAF